MRSTRDIKGQRTHAHTHNLLSEKKTLELHDCRGCRKANCSHDQKHGLPRANIGTQEYPRALTTTLVVVVVAPLPLVIIITMIPPAPMSKVAAGPHDP